MDLDITEFRQRLDVQIQKGHSDLVHFFYQEVRLAETMKAGLMEEMSPQNQDFLVDATSKIDTYMFKIKHLEKEMNLHHLPLDQEIAIQDSMHDQVMAKINELETLKAEIRNRTLVN